MDRRKRDTSCFVREQGIGDDIIFLSLVSEVKEMCKLIGICGSPFKPYASVPCRR